MQVLFRATKTMPELRIRTGQYLMVETAAAPEDAICVIEDVPPAKVPTILDNLGNLRLISPCGRATAEAALRTVAERANGKDGAR
jgi:hypothetical protein